MQLRGAGAEPAEREDGPILPGKSGAGWPLALQDIIEHHPSDPGDDFRWLEDGTPLRNDILIEFLMF